MAATSCPSRCACGDDRERDFEDAAAQPAVPTVTGMPRSALVVLVPEADGLVAALRLRDDPAAADGVPAHVTVLYPFVSPIDDDTVDKVAAICRHHAPFRAEFTAVDRFPGLVVWLRPEPAARFSELIAAVAAAFPDWPPYEGSVAEPVPHLTVADGVDAATASTLQAELERGLPVSSEVHELALLLQDETGRWNVARTWPFGGAIVAR
jgi:2'-5' RNA ligase